MPEKANHFTLWERTCCVAGSGVLIFGKFPSPETRANGVSQAIEVFQIVVNIIVLPPRKFSRRYYRGSTYIDCLLPAAENPRSLQSKSLQSRSLSIPRNSTWHVARVPLRRIVIATHLSLSGCLLRAVASRGNRHAWLRVSQPLTVSILLYQSFDPTPQLPAFKPNYQRRSNLYNYCLSVYPCN